MNDISTHFCLIEPDLISEQLLFGSEIAKPSTSPVFRCNSKITFDQQSEQSDAGTSWTQTFRGVTSDSSLLDWNNRKAYIGIFRTDGSLLIIGSATEAPMITVTPNVGAFVADATFQAIRPSII